MRQIAIGLFLILLLVPLANAQTGGSTTFKDPKGRFSIDYPAQGWKATPPENRFDKDLVTITTDTEEGRHMPSISIRILNLTSGNVERFMHDVEDAQREDPTFESNQGVECTKYVVDGDKACSIIYLVSLNDAASTKMATMEVGIIGNNGGNLYVIYYFSSPDDFDTYLPTVDQIIKSFKIGSY